MLLFKETYPFCRSKMFDKRKAEANPRIRDLLFGELPLSQWTGSTANEEPWNSFREAKQLSDAGNAQAAVQVFRRIAAMPDLESRHYLQSWHFLRGLGEFPASGDQKKLLGIVVEVSLKGGVDLLAAYADRHARYYNHSGGAVIWERPDNRLDSIIDKVLRAGAAALAAIGPWQGVRPSAPEVGHARINLLTPNGLHFGQGPMDLLSKDRIGAPVISAALELMLELIKLTKR